MLDGARADALEIEAGAVIGEAEDDFVAFLLEPQRDFADVALAERRAGFKRLETVRDLAEELFVLVTLGDERNVVATYVMGELASGCSTH